MRKTQVIRAFALGLACILPAACSETQLVMHTAKRMTDSQDSASRGIYKVGAPYQINGIWYYPHEDDRYREVGVASWYGSDFHGKRTGNGEIFDMNALTAAHRTLPMPSLVRVTNLGNGRSLVVRVNDRGPFANDRILDLSRRSAQLLGFESQGTTKVQVEILPEESLALKNELLRNASQDGEPKVEPAPRITVASESLSPLPVSGEPLPAPSASHSERPGPVVLKPEPFSPVKETAPPAPRKPTAASNLKAAPAKPGTVASKTGTAVPKAGAAAGKGDIFVQAGSFSSEQNARNLAKKLGKFGKTVIDEAPARNGKIYRVRVGPLKTKAAAEGTASKLRAEGFRDSRVVVLD
ncbi:MAG: septal ring lytic transglycosylase RlpA family protein [Alphaproteobacteria bacterium]|nr:septal ring lytic transglycosylase RlpA family protein [Alphaproteobacteria bacterium]MBF0129259.1 septal ring lytic transglycosylase RlpA family protein [Alphaproteobacteria bacterium]